MSTEHEATTQTRCPRPGCRHCFGVPSEAIGGPATCPACGQQLTVKPAAIWQLLDRRQAAFEANDERLLGLLDAPLHRGAGSPLLRQRLYHRPRGHDPAWQGMRHDLRYEASCDHPVAIAPAIDGLVAVLDDLRSQWNAGSVLRTAEGAGWGGLRLCGTTPAPPAPGVTRVSLGAERGLPWAYRAEVLSALGELSGSGHALVALEQTDDAVPVETFDPPERLALVLGNEVAGVSREALGVCGHRVFIPMAGRKASLNVAVAFGIAAFTLRRRWIERHGDR